MIADWFIDFADYLTQAIPRHDWPDSGTAFWDVMERAFRDSGLVQEAVAREAVFIVAARPPAFVADFPAALCAAGTTARDRVRLAGGDLPTDRAVAEAASRDCPECGGTGLTARHVWVARAQRHVSAGCCCHRCQAGRWLANYWRDREGPKPFDLDRRPQLWDEPLRYGPPEDAACHAELAEATA